MNLLSIESWNKLSEPESIDALLAEHVWEHLTYEEGIMAAKHCYKFLKPGGYIRCAVPDKNFRIDWYQQMVQVGCPGPSVRYKEFHRRTWDGIHNYRCKKIIDYKK